MKKIYVAHPFAGKRQNMQAITHICRNLVNLGVLPISPCHAFSFMNDKVTEDRKRALEFCEEMVELADEIWMFGEWKNSEGCILERNVALMEMIPIYEVVGWKDDMPVFEGEGPKWFNEKMKGGN